MAGRLGNAQAGHAHAPGGISSIAALRKRGFSDALVEGFFRPFLGGVFLDPELQPSSASLDFLFRMFARGDAALPAAGMGAIGAQLAAGLAPGTLRLRAPVARVERFGVVLLALRAGRARVRSSTGIISI